MYSVCLIIMIMHYNNDYYILYNIILNIGIEMRFFS